MKQAIAVVGVVLGLVGICLGALAQSQVGAVVAAHTQLEAALESQSKTEAARLDASLAELKTSHEASDELVQALQRELRDREEDHQRRRAALQLQLNALAGQVVQLKSAAAKPRASGNVPYIVNPKSRMPEVVLWQTAERSGKRGIARVPKGTKCRVLETKELARNRGGTMYKVRAVTGEEGWIPGFCIEFRAK